MLRCSVLKNILSDLLRALILRHKYHNAPTRKFELLGAELAAKLGVEVSVGTASITKASSF